MQFIDLHAQQSHKLKGDITLKEDIEKNIKKVIEHGQYILGPEVEQLEKQLENYVGVKNCITVSSGTDALLASLMALEIKPNDEVITTPFSFFATVETILLVGAKPIFIDITRDSYNLDYEKLEKAISSKTKAIIAVSLYGQTADMKNINKIADKYNIPVIEDGAQSFGAEHHNKKSGSLSTIGTTSFFPSKPLGGYGDGGACFTDDDRLAEKIRKIALHGQNKRYSHELVGLNGRLDTIQAAILLSKLKVFDKEIESRNRIANRYIRKFTEYGFLNTPIISKENKSVYAQFTIELDNRDKVKEYLAESSIPTSIHYPTLLSDQKALNNHKRNISLLKKFFKRDIYKSFDLKNAKLACKRVLSLPMHPYLEEEKQDLIINSVIKSLEIYK